MKLKLNFGILYLDEDLKVFAGTNTISFLGSSNKIKYLYSSETDLINIVDFFDTCSIPYKKYVKKNTIYRVLYKKYIIRNLDNFLTTTNDYKTNYDLLLKLLVVVSKLNINLNYKRISTISSLAYYIYQKRFYNQSFNVIFKLYPKEDDFLRKSYFGGRCGLVKSLENNVYFYDINSFFPYIMRDFPLPVGKPKKLYFLEDDFKLSEEHFGFFEITFKPTKYAVLPIRKKNKNIYPKEGEFRGTYFSEEIKLALKYNYSIVYHNGYIFEKRYIFKDYIEYFYTIKNTNKDYDMQKMGKKLLNHLYGSFGLDYKQSLEEIHLDTQLYIQDYKKNNLDEITYIDGGFLKTKRLGGLVRNVSIASAITSYSRILLYNYIIQYNPVYYDTDSLLLTSPLEDNLISENLGLFKKIYKKKIIGFIGVQIKFYALLFEDLSEKLVIRGYLQEHFVFSFFELKNKVLNAKNNNNKITMLLKTGNILEFDYVNDDF